MRAVAALPVLVPVFVALLAASCQGLLLLRAFSGPWALLFAVVLTALVASRLDLGEPGLTRRALAVDVLALLLAAGFAGVNAKYASQNLVIGRDPGVYAVTSEWLTKRRTVDVDTEARLFGSTTDLQTGSAGIGRRPEKDHVYPQGSHGLPAVLAVVGSLTSSRVMYGANALLGGLGLLAVYGFGRRVVGREGALVAAGVLGASLPQIAFSRDTYTEPISQLLLFGGLALLWQARRGRPLDWFVGGLVVAGGCLTRIDSFLVLPPLLLFAGLRLAFAEERGREVRDTGAMLLGATVPAVLGYLDLSYFAAGYLHTLRDQFGLIKLLVAACFVLMLLAALIAWTTPIAGWLRSWSDTARLRVGAALGGLVVLVAGVLALRPAFMTSHGIDNPGQRAFLAILQGFEGLPVDDTRSYAEHSVSWLAWYLGWPVVALGFAGLAWLLFQAVRRGELLLVPFFFVFALTGLNYLVDPSITPDQIWAMRRYVPIVLPGLALASMVVLVPAFQALVRRTRPGAVVAGLVVVALLLVPVLRTTRPYARIAEGVPQLREIELVCAAVPDDAGVLVVGALANRYPMTVRTFCDVPSTWSNSKSILTEAELAAVAASLQRNGRQLWVVGAGDIRPTVPTVDTPQVLNTIVVDSWERTLARAPRVVKPVGRDLYVGRVGADGRVVEWATS